MKNFLKFVTVINILPRRSMLIFKIIFFFNNVKSSKSQSNDGNVVSQIISRIASQTKILSFHDRIYNFSLIFERNFHFFLYFLHSCTILLSPPESLVFRSFINVQFENGSDSGCWSRSASVSSSWPHPCSFYFFSFFSFFFSRTQSVRRHRLRCRERELLKM